MKVTTTLLMALVLVGGLAGGTAQAGPPALPDDQRLQPIRGSLADAVAHAHEAGLPAELLVSKVREGLAKGVEPTQIQGAVIRMAQGLVTAQSFAASRRREKPSAGLVRALAEVQLAGIDLAHADALVREAPSGAHAAHAVEVLGDLALRGYPPGRTAPLVRELLGRDPAALPRLARTLEVMRREHALTAIEATDSLARGVSASGTLDKGLARAMDEERRRGPAAGKGKPGQDGREGPGKSPATPSHLLRGKPPFGNPRRP